VHGLFVEALEPTPRRAIEIVESGRYHGIPVRASAPGIQHDPPAMLRVPRIMDKKPIRATIRYNRKADPRDDTSPEERQSLEVEIVDAGAEPYVVLKTERWALDQREIRTLPKLLRWSLRRCGAYIPAPEPDTSTGEGLKAAAEEALEELVGYAEVAAIPRGRSHVLETALTAYIDYLDRRSERAFSSGVKLCASPVPSDEEIAGEYRAWCEALPEVERMEARGKEAGRER